MTAIVNGAGDGDKVDGASTLGLSGVGDSLAYRVAEVERHFHNWERWLELAATPNAEVHRADRAGTGAGIFQVDAGNNDWGAWLQILGSGDTPVTVGMLKYDIHRLLITATERDAIYVVQVGFGASGAAALSAGTYTEVVFIPASTAVDSGPVDVIARRQAAGTKAWARCKCPGQNTATLNFLVGLHEYEG